jgi:hypothetical protein
VCDVYVRPVLTLDMPLLIISIQVILVPQESSVMVSHSRPCSSVSGTGLGLRTSFFSLRRVFISSLWLLCNGGELVLTARGMHIYIPPLQGTCLRLAADVSASSSIHLPLTGMCSRRLPWLLSSLSSSPMSPGCKLLLAFLKKESSTHYHQFRSQKVFQTRPIPVEYFFIPITFGLGLLL